jgi:hypothetical protein
MNLRLIHLEQRIKDLETLADEVINLAERLTEQDEVQPELSLKGQR